MTMCVRRNKKGSDFKGNPGHSCTNESKQTQAHPALLILSAVVDGTTFYVYF